MRVFDRLLEKPKKTFVNNTNLEKELSETLVRDAMSKQWIVAPSSTTVHQISKMTEQGKGLFW